MIWGCFSYFGVGNIEIIEGTMDSAYYIDIISRNLMYSAEKMGIRNFIFQQDNDPKHTSRLTKEYFLENNIKLLDWPAQSPDLNPIEHLWALLKGRISEKMPKNISELKTMVYEEWNAISIEICQKYALSFKKRALEIYKANGEHTKY